jgi:hypothetical protein
MFVISIKHIYKKENIRNMYIVSSTLFVFIHSFIHLYQRRFFSLQYVVPSLHAPVHQSYWCR